MYDLNTYSLGRRLKEIRKNNKMTLEELGSRIGKTKATISKYENESIIPDFITVMEVCNVFNININQLCELEAGDMYEKRMSNPFSTDKLFMYYISLDGLVASTIEINGNGYTQNVILKNALKDKTNKCAYEFIGRIEHEKDVAFINLSNSVSNSKFEKVEIIIDLKSIENNNYKGCILGTTDNNTPTIRKCIITEFQKLPKEVLNEFYEELKITEDESEKILKNKYWNIDTKKIDEFFVSID